MFAAPLRVNDRVISPAQVQATLPTHYDKVILAICCPVVLPTRFQMKNLQPILNQMVYSLFLGE